MKRKAETIICDANILIDFCIADKMIISYTNEYLFTIYIPDIILAEVNNLEKPEAIKLGCEILVTPLELLNDGGSFLPGCSFQDTVCFIQANNYGWACATNDKKLRKECNKAGIKVYWGLEIILMLVKEGVLSCECNSKTPHRIKKI